MKASELYTKTIEGYKQEISVSPITLHDYCKTHHVNYKGIQLWMSRNSITVAQLKRKITVHSDSPSDFPVVQTESGQQIYPLSFQTAGVQKQDIRKSTYSCVKGVNITFPDGVIVSIKEITQEDLNKFILSCNTH
nr:hypothetical protein [uncultured Bacteroides sp.]